MTVAIIADRERVNMVTGWTEFLCLDTGDNKKFRLFTGRYKSLGPSPSYRDPETGEYSLPDEIDGETVVGTEDDWVVGGELDWYDPDDTVEFDELDEEDVQIWLDASGWGDETESIMAALKAK
jgi:hypothetical protein